MKIVADLVMHLRFVTRPDVHHQTWSYRDDDERWHVIKRGPRYTMVYHVRECDDAGLAWLYAHREDRPSDPIIAEKP